METTVNRKTMTVSLPEYMLTDLGREAKRRKTTLSLLIERMMEEMLYKPNRETMEAIEEARSGAEMDDFNPDELDRYIYAAEEVDTV